MFREKPTRVSQILNLAIRFLQFVLALTVLGLYGTDLDNARKQGKYTDSKWVFAEVVGALAAVTALIYMLPLLKYYWTFGWDVVILILWIALFGLFGKMFINEDPEGNAGTVRMKNAVWVDLANVLLWLISALYGAVLFVRHRRGKSLHTGRATV